MIRKLGSNYSFVIIGLMAAGMFSLLQPGHAAPEGEGKEHKLLMFLDANAFGVYLLHFLFLKIAVTLIPWNPYRSGGNLVLAAVTLAVFLLSLGLTWILRLIPGVKRVL